MTTLGNHFPLFLLPGPLTIHPVKKLFLRILLISLFVFLRLRRRLFSSFQNNLLADKIKGKTIARVVWQM
jgi:hypothetical protein